MPASTAREVLDLASYRLHDTRNRRHSRSELLDLLSQARRELAGVFGRIDECGLFETWSSEIALAASATELSLPDNFTGLKLLFRVISPVATGGDGEKKDRVEIIRRNKVGGTFEDSPTFLTGNAIKAYIQRRSDTSSVAVIRPKSTTARYFVMLYRYTFPDPFLNQDESTGCDIELNELLTLWVAIHAAKADEERVYDWQQEYDVKIANLITSFQGSADQLEAEQVESSYFDEINGSW
ncbi:MAG TPA: hypothetical protein VM285_12435 [Polyangia bacterium]|nr:hypothetical protein [Polyangia bacterium]